MAWGMVKFLFIWHIPECNWIEMSGNNSTNKVFYLRMKCDDFHILKNTKIFGDFGYTPLPQWYMTYSLAWILFDHSLKMKKLKVVIPSTACRHKKMFYGMIFGGKGLEVDIYNILCYFWRQNCLITRILAFWTTLVNACWPHVCDMIKYILGACKYLSQVPFPKYHVQKCKTHHWGSKETFFVPTVSWWNNHLQIVK